MKDAKVITVPPPQMVSPTCASATWSLRRRALEPPRHHRRRRTAITTQTSGKTTLKKSAGHHRRIRQENPNNVRAVTAAILEAGKWIDASLGNKNKMAETIADVMSTPAWTPSTSAFWAATRTWAKPGTNYSYELWRDGGESLPVATACGFTQHKRWLMKEHLDYLAMAKQINQIDIYKQAARRQSQRAHQPDAQQQADGRRGAGRPENPVSTPTASKSKPDARLRRPATPPGNTKEYQLRSAALPNR
jgi:nitrate/nitrite transport system substrate-binding protein